jgi:hypothetical protein
VFSFLCFFSLCELYAVRNTVRRELTDRDNEREEK